MRRALATLALLATVATLAAAAQEDQGFSIRFSEKKVYFVGDEVRLEALITNESTQTLRFKVADNRAFNLDFDVRTTTNLALEHAREFTIARTSDQPVYFREVSLEPGEKYAIDVDVARYASLTQPGLYVLQASFYPELYRGPSSVAMKSNRLTLNLRPAPATAEEKAVVEAEAGALIARQSLPPDEVVAYTIQARQRSQWDKFFLYLDLEKLLRKNPDKDRVFRRQSEDGRRAMIEQFKQDLRQVRIEGDINVIPTSFEVQKTTYGPAEGTVQVLERFRYPDYTELKSYTYHLQRQDKYWIIVDYEIRNIGTE